MSKSTGKQLALFPGMDKPLVVPNRPADVYARVAEATDEQTAAKFSELVAGLAVYIPARVDGDHWLVDALGAERAQAVCDVIADGFGVTMDFPMGEHSQKSKRDQDVVDMLNAGHYSVNEMAAAVGTSRRNMHRIINRLQKNQPKD
ncbi:MAG: hypothetical protein AAFQ10_03330 [Pseudomonadota bacterium]